jgi:DNA-binding NarL/FixJ family response regulator
MGTRGTYQKVLVQACLAVGDEATLARRLDVPLPSLVDWLLGHGTLPTDVFLRAVEIVLARSKDQVRANRALLARMQSAKKLSERAAALAFIESESGIVERLARGAPLESVLSVLVLAMESLSPGVLGSVLLLSGDGRARHAAAPSLPRAYVKAIDGLSIGPAVGSCGTAMHLRKTVIVSDIATDPLWHNYRKHALTHGLRACWSAPIVSPGREVLGAFALYYREVRSPRRVERRLVEIAAELAAIAIDRAGAQWAAAAAQRPRGTLSTREAQVVQLIAQGQPVKRIAEDLGLTISTVYTHRARIFEKLGINSNARLVRYAIDQRMIR